MAGKTEKQNVPCPTTKTGGTSKQRASSERIGQHLRSIYAEALAERVPDSFEELLKKLR